jgi:hypothetical protein
LSVQAFLRESTWGYPIIGAIHVLGIAWFGGTILVGSFVPQLENLRKAGLALLLASGALLFLLHPAQYFHSVSFLAKMLLLVLLTRAKPASALSFALWAAIIVASRGIAFF